MDRAGAVPVTPRWSGRSPAAATRTVRRMRGALMDTEGPAREASAPRGGAVVVAYDGSRQATAALRWGAAEALALGAPLDVVIAWQRPLLVRASSGSDPAEDYARLLAARATDTVAQVAGGQLDLRPHVEEGAPPPGVLRRAQGGRLVVMGTAGHVGRLGAVLGSVSRHVVDRVDVPVVLLGPDAAGSVESRITVVARF